MKDSTQDELKSLFDNAFQAEQIPFDPGAWDQMNNMLNKRQRRKVLGLWFSSGALFLAASASLLLLFGNTSPVYAPRTAEASFTYLEKPEWQDNPVTRNASTPEQPNSEEIMPTAASEPMAVSDPVGTARTVDSSEPGSVAVSNASGQVSSEPEDLGSFSEPTEGDEADMISVNTPSSPRDEQRAVESEPTGSVAGDLNDDSVDAVPSTITAELSSSGTDETEPEADNETTRPDIHIDFTEVLNARITQCMPGGTIVPPGEDVEESEQSKLRLFYLSGGFSKTVNNASFSTYTGQGYRVGLGVSEQLKNSWHLGAELNMVHEPFSDTTIITGQPTYGFTRGENEHVVHTTRLMYAEMPLMIGYRFKRFSVNTGASIGYMLGLKNETLTSLRYNATTIDQSTESGYYRWDRYRSLHLGGLIDAQYQLTAAVPNAFVGIRYTYGITELLTIEQRNVRKSRIEIYLKMTLK